VLKKRSTSRKKPRAAQSAAAKGRSRPTRSKKAASKSESAARTTRGTGNKRAKPKARALKAQAKRATWEEPIAWRPDPLHLKHVVGLLLVPVCFLTTETFFSTIAYASAERGLWLSPEFLFFLAGGLLWLVYFVGFPNHRPIRLYVWGHETSHAAAAVVFGAQVSGFTARKTGGHIYTTKSNFIISLAPYLVPIYTLMILGAAVVGSIFFDILGYDEKGFFGVAGLSPLWVLLGLIGFSWSFHLTFTVWMIARFQPDLEENGNFFSLILIYLTNLLIICLFVIGFSKHATFVGFGQDWINNAAALKTFIVEAFDAGIRMGRRLISGA